MIVCPRQVRAAHLVDLLRARLPAAEVDYAVEDALLEAGAAGAPYRKLGWTGRISAGPSPVRPSPLFRLHDVGALSSCCFPCSVLGDGQWGEEPMYAAHVAPA